MNRCVNIDWLQVYCSEPNWQTQDASYFSSKGYEVEMRPYGTPQYKEMFTIKENGFPFIEVRRNPYSIKAFGGIFEPNDCHLRLANRACYSQSPINDLRRFMIAHGYRYKSISRIDICLDFNFFDFGDRPDRVLLDYMKGKISKINQSNIAAHGKDRWDGRLWNSLSWGSKNSMISTKMYNKSLELREVHPKYYITDQWEAAGLRTDIDVWRVEFSIKSDMKGMYHEDTGEFQSNNLTDYDTRDKCIFRFHSLANKYFHFKYVEYTRDGKLQRKDRCKDKVLFHLTRDEQAYKPCRLTNQSEPTRTDKILERKLEKIRSDTHLATRYRIAADTLIHYFHFEKRLPAQIEKAHELLLTLEEAVQ